MHRTLVARAHWHIHVPTVTTIDDAFPSTVEIMGDIRCPCHRESLPSLSCQQSTLDDLKWGWSDLLRLSNAMRRASLRTGHEWIDVVVPTLLLRMRRLLHWIDQHRRRLSRLPLICSSIRCLHKYGRACLFARNWPRPAGCLSERVGSFAPHTSRRLRGTSRRRRKTVLTRYCLCRRAASTRCEEMTSTLMLSTQLMREICDSTRRPSMRSSSQLTHTVLYHIPLSALSTGDWVTVRSSHAGGARSPCPNTWASSHLGGCRRLSTSHLYLLAPGSLSPEGSGTECGSDRTADSQVCRCISPSPCSICRAWTCDAGLRPTGALVVSPFVSFLCGGSATAPIRRPKPSPKPMAHGRKREWEPV